MKKKKRLFVIIPLIITVLILLIVGSSYAVFYQVMVKSRVTHSDIKSIDLSDLNEIKITDNNETVTLDADDDKYKIICDAFKRKRVKIDYSRVYFWNKNEYRVELKTKSQNYILYGSPEMFTDDNFNSELTDPVVFVLYDYTKNSVDYMYQIVTISKDDFLKIFPDFK